MSNQQPWTGDHLQWFIDSNQKVMTADGKPVEVWVLNHENDNAILSAWAKHFRNHYCLDTEIDVLRHGTGLSRSEYLTNIKFPDRTNAPGPSVRAGDFGEILIADYLEYLLDYWVPRTRYADRVNRNDPTKGCDVIGFKIDSHRTDSPDDVLAIYEVKAHFTSCTVDKVLQNAITHSAKDPLRKGESLNAIKQRLRYWQLTGDAERVERFQNMADHPCKEQFGAVALITQDDYDATHVCHVSVSSHPHRRDILLLVIVGNNMMNLVHELYRRAANEA